MMPFTTEVQVIPGYDHRDEPDDRRGAHGLELRFVLRGELGAITWSLQTGWMERPLAGPFIPGGKQSRLDRPGADARLRDLYPSAGPVASHAIRKPSDWSLGPDKCDVVPTGECWGDCGYLVGDDVLAAMMRGGHAAVFSELEGFYLEWIVNGELMKAGA